MRKNKSRYATTALEDVKKILGIKKVRDDVVNLGTLREQKTSVFKLELEADIVNSEWDNLSEEMLIKVLYVRFQSHLDCIFDEDYIAKKYLKEKINE